MKTNSARSNNRILYAFLLLFFLLTVFFHSKLSKNEIYPPIFSKKFPLSTPISFWATMLGMRRLAADIVWIQAMQYYGKKEEDQVSVLSNTEHGKLRLLYPELKNYWQQIIRFDPTFVTAHLVGPITLAWNHKRYGEALELLDEGITMLNNISEKFKNIELKEVDERHPFIVGKGSYFEELKWKLYILKATIVYFNQEKYGQAVIELEKIAFLKGTPEEIQVILAQVYEERNENTKAIRLWIEIYEKTVNLNRKKSASNNIIRLKEIISSG